MVKNKPANEGDASSILGLGRSPGGGNGNPLQYSCLKNPMDRGAWGVTVQAVAKSWTRLKRLSIHACRSVRITDHCRLSADPQEDQGPSLGSLRSLEGGKMRKVQERRLRWSDQ